MKHSLKEAKNKRKLDVFIKEHQKDARGDADKFDAILNSAIGKSLKSTEETSEQDFSESSSDTQTP